jgi:hypothetical protein
MNRALGADPPYRRQHEYAEDDRQANVGLSQPGSGLSPWAQGEPCVDDRRRHEEDQGIEQRYGVACGGRAGMDQCGREDEE